MKSKLIFLFLISFSIISIFAYFFKDELLDVFGFCKYGDQVIFPGGTIEIPGMGYTNKGRCIKGELIFEGGYSVSF